MATLRSLGFALSFVLVASLVSGSALQAQDQPPDPAELAKLFADWAEMAPEHKLLKKHVGQWKADIKSYYENPDQPTQSEGTSRFRLIMGGRFLMQTYKGEYNGQAFEGLGLTGYDKSQKKYVGVWLDSMGTGMMHTEGEYDEKTGALIEIGEADSPVGKMKTKNVTKHIDRDTMSFIMYMVLPDGSEAKTMEITYKRVQNEQRKKRNKKQGE